MPRVRRRAGAPPGSAPPRVRLLLDENVSPQLVRALADLFPESTHLRDVGLSRATDDAVWTYAAPHGYVIVSKDAEFHQRSFLLGHPPKVVWIRRGNCSTRSIEALLRARHPDLVAFEADPDGSFLALS